MKKSWFDNKKKVPSYWWDFEDRGDKYYVVVESDDDRFPIVGKFEYNLMDGDGFKLPTMRLGCAAKAIEQAEKLIKDLKAGRISPTKIKI